MCNSIAENMLLKDVLLNVDMLECLRRKSADIIFASTSGVLIYDRQSKAHMMSATNMETAEVIIEQIPKDVNMLVGHQEMYYDLLMKKLHFEDKMVCFNAVYMKDIPIKIPKCLAEISMLTEEYIDDVMKNYSKADVLHKAYIENRIKNNVMYGAFIDGKICGFIGIHEEGSIGMLEVLKAYRGMGIAKVLQAVATNDALKQGRYPYGQIVKGNVPSINLQKKLGFEISEGKAYWLFKS
jgi:GNAT superfamily N-acetyltransferase